MLNEFIEIYNLPKDSIFKRVELEDALINQFGSLKYNMFPEWMEKDTGFEHPTTYYVGVKYNWGDCDFSSELCLSPEEALLNLFIKYGKSEFDINDILTYYEGSEKEFKQVVRKVYGQFS